MRFCTWWTVVGLLATACGVDVRPECAAVVDPGEIVVDTSGAAPVFSWSAR
jgi:hypothetical protein